MTLTVLFDLDDTLLGNPISKFMSAYLKLLGEHLSGLVRPEFMIPQLLRSTELMIRKEKPCNTLQTVFEADFYPSLGLTKEKVTPLISQFYSDVFPELRQITNPLPAATSLIDFVFANGFNIVIATNPLFPIKAIEERLKWAGFPVDKYPYKLITSYEKMHFAKPNSAYYAEILGQLGWPEGPVCVVGNSLTDDILPASQLGIPGFLISQNDAKLPPHLTPGSAAGELKDVLPWLVSMNRRASLPNFSDPLSIKSVLSTTPAALDTITEPLLEPQWLAKPIKDEWSVYEIICHMRDVELEVNLPRMQQFQEEKNPFIAGIDSDIWVSERNYNSAFTPQSFLDFCNSRTVLLETLNILGPESWGETARHSIFGPTTLNEIASFITTHDRNHVHQVVSTIAAL